MNMLYKYLAVISSFFIAKNQAKTDLEWEQEQAQLAKYGKTLTKRSNHQYLDRRSVFRDRYKHTALINDPETKEKRHTHLSQFPHSRWLNFN
jgi:hypothetical protein